MARPRSWASRCEASAAVPRPRRHRSLKRRAAALRAASGPPSNVSRASRRGPTCLRGGSILTNYDTSTGAVESENGQESEGAAAKAQDKAQQAAGQAKEQAQQA